MAADAEPDEEKEAPHEKDQHYCKIAIPAHPQKKRQPFRAVFQSNADGGYSSKEWITTPERSFGSNHVVFGVMMLPVSAMLMSCCIETG